MSPTNPINPVPDGFRTVTPHLYMKGAAEAIEFYKRAFGATERGRNLMPDGRVMHAEIVIGDSILFVVDDFPEWNNGRSRDPRVVGTSTVAIHLYVEDCDAWTKRAADAGCAILMGPMDAFWGDRFAMVRDPFGHEWTIGQHTRDMTPEQRMAEMKASMGGG